MQIVVDFWATWCGPCKVIGPKFEELSDDPAYADLVFAKVDVDECPQVAEEAGVQVRSPAGIACYRLLLRAFFSFAS